MTPSDIRVCIVTGKPPINKIFIGFLILKTMEKEKIKNFDKKGYAYIFKRYGDIRLGEEHPLFYYKEPFLKLFDSWLKKLDNIKNIGHLIKKSRNPQDFDSIVSEIEICAMLFDYVDNIEVIVNKTDNSYDFKITILKKDIAIEIKRVKEKLDYGEEKVVIKIVDDIKTVFNHVREYEKKGQYSTNLPNIIVFDCSSGMGEDEFYDVLYPKKDVKIPLRNKQGKIVAFGTCPYDGVYYKKEGKQFKFLSGIAGYFKGYSYSLEEGEKGPRIVFFPNPNATIPLDKKLIDSLGWLLDVKFFNTFIKNG
jgi:hypothetical protein